MSRIRKTILLSGATVQLLMLLFPPFIFHPPLTGTTTVLNQGYSFIFTPPLFDGSAYPTVNVALLALQAGVIAFITGLLHFAFAANRQGSSTKGGGQLFSRISHEDAIRRGPESTSKTLLIVDDSPEIVHVLAEKLQEEYPDLRVKTAFDGLEAIETIKAQVPSLLIVGVNMPGMSGIELLTILHRNAIVLPAIVMSGCYKPEDFKKWLVEERILYKEKFLFLKKPFRFEEVQTWLQNAQEEG